MNRYLSKLYYLLTLGMQYMESFSDRYHYYAQEAFHIDWAAVLKYITQSMWNFCTYIIIIYRQNEPRYTILKIKIRMGLLCMVTPPPPPSQVIFSNFWSHAYYQTYLVPQKRTKKWIKNKDFNFRKQCTVHTHVLLQKVSPCARADQV